MKLTFQTIYIYDKDIASKYLMTDTKTQTPIKPNNDARNKFTHS